MQPYTSSEEPQHRPECHRLPPVPGNDALVPWVADARTWEFTYVGPQAVELLGFPVEDWFEGSFWTDRIHPDDRSDAISKCTTLSREGGSYEFADRMVRSDGEVIWVNDIVSVEMGDTGPVRLCGFLIDVTSRRHCRRLSSRPTGGSRTSCAKPRTRSSRFGKTAPSLEPTRWPRTYSASRRRSWSAPSSSVSFLSA